MNKEVYTKMSEQQLEKAPASNEPVQESMKDYEDQFDIANPWNIVQRYMDEKTTLTLKVEGIVNGGVIVKVEGLRGFIPASRLSLTYIENLEDYLLKDVRVRVIDADESENRLVLSAREILKKRKHRKKLKKFPRSMWEISWKAKCKASNPTVLSSDLQTVFPVSSMYHRCAKSESRHLPMS